MSWETIVGHQSALERFQKSARRNRLASTYLFVGPSGIGKRTFALKLAQSLLCSSTPESALECCSHCPACQQVLSGSHPDLIQVAKPADKKFIPVETFIGDREHRRQRGMCHDIGLKPFYGGRKIAIIDDADDLNAESANSLLKTLEEPPPKSILILIGTSQQRQLQTIISRSQVVHFSPLTAEQVQEVLERHHLLDPETDPRPIAQAANGSVEQAIRLSNPELLEFVQLFYHQLASLDPTQEDFAKSLGTFVESAGKDAALKRRRLSEVGDFAIYFYRDLLHRSADSREVHENLEKHTADSLSQFRQTGFTDSVIQEAASACIRRTLSMQQEVHANAMQANVITNWLADLGRLSRAEITFDFD